MSLATARARALDIGESLSALGTISVSRFFGGAALLADGVQFAFVIKGSLYLRTDDDTRPLFEARGAQPFSFRKRNGMVTVTSYYEAPPDIIEDGEELCIWARRALGAAAGRSKARGGDKGRQD